MAPRRSHKKSRAGCRRCKVRKIKCNEVHPRCGNCSKHGVLCDFEKHDDNQTSPDTPHATASASPTNSNCDSPSAATSPLPVTPSAPASTPAPLYRNPEPLPLTSTSKNNRMMELKLLHHYTTITCETLAISSPVSEKIWRETVPCLAFSGASFLADALLAVSALHLRSHAPQDQDLIRASHSYMASTFSEYSASLSKGITESNAEALFLTAALIAFQSTASRIFARDDGGDMKDRSGGYALPLSWFHSFQGVKAVVASSWQWLRNSGIVVPIIESQPALNLNLSGNPTFFSDLLIGVEEEVTSLDDDPARQMATRQAYQHAVAVLDWAHKIPHTGAPLVFLATVSRRFVELLEARRPRALAILASYFGLLKCLDSVWWLKGVARREVMGIVSLFDPDDEEWWPRLQWPLRIALIDGDGIPADVWGADWAAEKALMDQASQSGSFVSHIELLSQMFSAMQNLPNNMPDALDPFTHQYALGREKASRQQQLLLSDELQGPEVD
ncbi:Uu.00g008490.m01.CDS01 [Anthostomella pinea]|uniref:Uu.00g008490.m01.CDS01 n=1 Tax=Anthostomella pinea TaxID=933095 RepID=A0AAI8VXV3_9PEZI|nr:Uu.00g008490.m01.CDS01 [Anthostomella pinea]